MNHRLLQAVALVVPFAAAPLAAQTPDEPESESRPGLRSELSLGAHAWPNASDLTPLAGGSFDDAGFNLGGAVHWPLPGFADHGVMLGVDFVLFPTESDVPFRSEDLTLRGGHLTSSLRWYPRSQQRFSVDAGAGVYVADIAEVRTDYGFFTETELWEATTAGGYVGGTWNFGNAESSGMFVSFKAHFFDFGEVRDEDALLPATLGAGAGSLGGPLYQLQFGYRWR